MIFEVLWRIQLVFVRIWAGQFHQHFYADFLFVIIYYLNTPRRNSSIETKLEFMDNFYTSVCFSTFSCLAVPLASHNIIWQHSLMQHPWHLRSPVFNHRFTQ